MTPKYQLIYLTQIEGFPLHVGHCNQLTQERLKFKRRRVQCPIRKPQVTEENGASEAMLRIWKQKITDRGDHSGVTMENGSMSLFLSD